MTIVNIHIVQTLPASNLNRDDTGSPKSQVFGGTRRLRISSQAQKAAIRKKFAEIGDRFAATRTLFSPQIIIERAAELDPSIDPDKAAEIMTGTLKGLKTAKAKGRAEKKDDNSLKTSALFSVSKAQIDAAAALLVEALNGDGKIDKKGFLDALSSGKAVDQALFGRFYADERALIVDAAVQVAHALGTATMPHGFDYYTARDDLGAVSGEEGSGSGSGAGMIGFREFSSGPLYRYAAIDVNKLLENLDDAPLTVDGVAEFIRAFIEVLPSGSQNSYAANVLPTTVLVEITDGAGISFAGAFEAPCDTADAASERLIAYADRLHEVYGNAPENAFSSTLALGLNMPEWVENVRADEIVEKVRSVLVEKLGV